jgi:hypothetical protein
MDFFMKEFLLERKIEFIGHAGSRGGSEGIAVFPPVRPGLLYSTGLPRTREFWREHEHY